MAFNKNVFINCPFDQDFIPLIRPLVFTIIYLDLDPQISQTISSGKTRNDQIQEYIRKSKFSIHDLSRSKPLKKGDLPRFNMPYELGLDIGCNVFGGKKYLQKRILILETQRFYYHSVLSDISGKDIENHNDDPKTLVLKVRNWFSANTADKISGPSEIWTAFNQFTGDLHLALEPSYSATEIAELPIGDYIKFARDWIRDFKSK